MFGTAYPQEGHQGIHTVGSAVGAGLRHVAALGQLIDNDSDAPEERRKQIEARQAASNLGAVIGLAAGIIGALTEKEKEEHSFQEEKEFKEFLSGWMKNKNTKKNRIGSRPCDLLPQLFYGGIFDKGFF